MIPNNCPSCGYKLIYVNDQLFCKNSSACPAQTSKAVEHYSKTVKIKGLASKRIETLGLEKVEDIYSMSEEFIAEKLGAKVASTLMAEIEKSRLLEFGTYIAAQGIPLVGPTIGRKLSEQINSLEELNKETCKAAGLGDKATANILEWVSTHRQLAVTFSSKVPTKTITTKGVVCISGKLTGYTKKQAEQLLAEAGYETKSSVTKDVTILITETTGSSKYNKALDLGLTIISLEKLLNG